MNFEIKTGKYEEKCKEQLKEQISSHIFLTGNRILKCTGSKEKKLKLCKSAERFHNYQIIIKYC